VPCRDRNHNTSTSLKGLWEDFGKTYFELIT